MESQKVTKVKENRYGSPNPKIGVWKMVDKKGTEVVVGSEVTIKGIITAVVGPKVYIDIPSDLENGHTERVTLPNNHFLVTPTPVKKEKS